MAYYCEAIYVLYINPYYISICPLFLIAMNPYYILISPLSLQFVLSTQQAQAEAEEEFISNTLLKKIHSLKKEKEALAMNYEQEEEFLTNDLSRKLAQVRQTWGVVQ